MYSFCKKPPGIDSLSLGSGWCSFCSVCVPSGLRSCPSCVLWFGGLPAASASALHCVRSQSFYLEVTLLSFPQFSEFLHRSSYHCSFLSFSCTSTVLLQSHCKQCGPRLFLFHEWNSQLHRLLWGVVIFISCFLLTLTQTKPS